MSRASAASRAWRRAVSRPSVQVRFAVLHDHAIDTRDDVDRIGRRALGDGVRVCRKAERFPEWRGDRAHDETGRDPLHEFTPGEILAKSVVGHVDDLQSKQNDVNSETP